MQPKQAAMPFMKKLPKPKNNDPLFVRCIEVWGAEAQIRQGADECTELALALLHVLREKKTKALDCVIEEMADVELMMEQVKYMLSIPQDLIEKVKAKKVRRLKRLLKGSQ